MGFFGRIFGKKDDFLSDSKGMPPDFSQPAAQDPFSGDLYGQDPLRNSDPFASQATPGTQTGAPGMQPPGAQPPGSGAPGQEQGPFAHDIFSSDTVTNADNARAYAQGLGGGQQQGQASYAGALTGHEAQLILERLDTIKAELDAIKQRMMRVERFMDAAEQKTGQRKYF